jgi:hypothetical protein
LRVIRSVLRDYWYEITLTWARPAMFGTMALSLLVVLIVPSDEGRVGSSVIMLAGVSFLVIDAQLESQARVEKPEPQVVWQRREATPKSVVWAVLAFFTGFGVASSILSANLPAILITGTLFVFFLREAWKALKIAE